MDTTSKRGTTKSGGQKHNLDKFYTKPEIAKWCLEKLTSEDYDVIIEPSAGGGAFSNQIPNVLAFDLNPEAENVTEQDWFKYEQIRTENVKTLVVGNPPFGQQNSLALKFINHAAVFADTIAFILPKSFMKESLQEKINPHFILREETVLPQMSFTLNGNDAEVPCVFQIWDYSKTIPREHKPMPIPKGFIFVKKNANPDLFLQRIGGRAGTVGTEWENRSEQSNYFIKLNPGYETQPLIEEISKLVFESKNNSVGPRSISKKEFLTELKNTGSAFM